jgi:UDP-N-acetylmuramoyl-L-alanyl-D-glutamate--2,6-diaminopimelate ligase
MPDIKINSVHLQKGDTFFCDKTAEEYLTEGNILLASLIYVNLGFFERIEKQNIIISKNQSFNYKNIKTLIEQKAIRDKFIEIDNFQDILVQELKKKYKLPKKIFAVTGTKGKTSTAWYIFNLLNILGLKASYFGSVGFYTFNQDTKQPQIINQLENTTPFIDDFYRIMDESCKMGCNHVVFEASNHAIHQGRFQGIKSDISTFTNIGNDHLDYFKTFEAGFNAKKKLFTNYTASYAVLNADIPEYQDMYNLCSKSNLQIISYGKQGDICLKKIALNNFQQEVLFNYQNLELSFKTDIVGSFQVHNILAAVANLMILNFNIKNITEALKFLISPRGRMEFVQNSLKKHIYVDYSHNADSLMLALQCLRDLRKNQNLENKSKIITIFGCGGDRDRVKRPVMGFVSSRMSDISIITNDNIRTEDEDFIVEEILSGVNITNKDLEQESKEKFAFTESFKQIKDLLPNFQELQKNTTLIEKDRKSAIIKAIQMMGDLDILLIAGKGHEDYQIIGTEKFPFDDKKIVSDFLSLN